MNILVNAHGGLGDELCMTPTYRELGKDNVVYTKTMFPDILIGNPYTRVYGGESIDRTIDMLWHNESGYGYDMHLVDYYAHQANVVLSSRKLDIYLGEDNISFANSVLDGIPRPIVMYCEYKGWESKGILTYNMIYELAKLPISLVRVGDRPKWCGIGYNLVGYTDTILNTAAILSKSDLYIGNDSGIAHVAGAVGCRSIILYGSTRYNNYLHDNQIPLYNSTCNGCYNDGNRDIVKGMCPRGDFICSKVEVETLISSIEEILCL